MWIPTIVTDEVTGRRVLTGIFESDMYESGELSFEELWYSNQPLEGQIALEGGVAV